MSSLGLSGVFSGVDTDTLIAQILAINSRPIALLEARKQKWQDRVTAIDTISTRLGQLQALADELRDVDSLRNVTASSSDGTILTATASGSAVEGFYSIEINQLAAGHRLVHTDGLAAQDTRVGASKSTARDDNGMADPDAVWFTTSANGATYTFDFGGETDIDEAVFAASTAYSLNQVAALINARSQAVAGYDAATVEEDGGTYYLRLTAEEPGPIGELTHVLTAGDSIAELNDEADWTKTDGAGGLFQFTYDGVTRSYNTGSGTTLSDLVAMINNDAENPGVSASLLEYDSGSGLYHLVLSGRDSGSDYAITIGAGTTLLGFDDSGGNWTVPRQAQDSQIRVDGYPPGDWIERSTNSITDVIPGVTLNLMNTTGTGDVTLTLARSTSGLQNDLENLISIYNGVADKVDDYAGFNEETETGGVLQGNAAVVGLLSQMRVDLAGTAKGFVSGTDAFTMLAEVGIEFDSEGRLELDSSKLDEAIEQDYEAVLELIGALASGASNDDYIQFVSAEGTTEAGTYEVSITFNGSGEITQALIRTKGDEVWRNATWSGNTLMAEEGNPEEGLVFSAVWDGVSTTQTAEIRVRKGFAAMLYDRLEAVLDDETGYITTTKERFQNQIETIDKNIETQIDRLATQRQHLIARFARLEATLAQLDAQRGVFDALLSSLNNNDSNS